MWPFRRKKNDDTTPPEVQDYYQSQRRERSWMAWLLGIGTLVGTVLVVLGLFYGGRWVYRKVRTQDRPPVAQVDKQSATPQETNPMGDAPVPPNPANNPAPTPQTSPQAPVPTPQPPLPNQTTRTPNTTGKGGSNMPATGPADNTAIFLLVSVAGYVLHRRFRKNTEQA